MTQLLGRYRWHLLAVLGFLDCAVMKYTSTVHPCKSEVAAKLAFPVVFWGCLVLFIFLQVKFCVLTICQRYPVQLPLQLCPGSSAVEANPQPPGQKMENIYRQ